MVALAASLLSADPAYLAREIQEAEHAGCDRFHIDVMDGHFVPNIGFGPQTVDRLKSYTCKPFEIHLMVDNPEIFLRRYAAVGSDTLIIHVEAASDRLPRLLREIRGHGCRCGVALNPKTSLERVVDILAMVDSVLVMTVEPGFPGQTFLEPQLKKIEALSGIIDTSVVDLAIDGGVSEDNASRIVAAGATSLIIGTALFGGQGCRINARRLHRVLSD